MTKIYGIQTSGFRFSVTDESKKMEASVFVRKLKSDIWSFYGFDGDRAYEDLCTSSAILFLLHKGVQRISVLNIREIGKITEFILYYGERKKSLITFPPSAFHEISIDATKDNPDNPIRQETFENIIKFEYGYDDANSVDSSDISATDARLRDFVYYADMFTTGLVNEENEENNDDDN